MAHSKPLSQPSLFSNPGSSPPLLSAKNAIEEIEFPAQINLDQQRYSRYVCDSRAIPHVIDGLKPVQRRILWTMWNSDARARFTKTVKVAGMTMAYHPHGNTSIEDAIASMVQSFSFANNYPLLEGEGTFGDVLDPKAIASPRYTEVRLSPFVIDAGFFESLEDVEYIANYDDTEKEPVFFIPKLPTILLNPTVGIATGFRCSFPARNIADVGEVFLNELLQKSEDSIMQEGITPWFRHYKGKVAMEFNDNASRYYQTSFAFAKQNKKTYLTAAPQGWNREKTLAYLETLSKNPNSPLRDYFDHSATSFRIELIFTRGTNPNISTLEKLFEKKSRDSIEQNVISSFGTLAKKNDLEIIREFIKIRLAHLRARFQRLANIEEARIAKESELIRFIKEGWHKRVPEMANKKALEEILTRAEFQYAPWLTGLPIYRMTAEEAAKAEQQIAIAQKELARCRKLEKGGAVLKNFVIEESKALIEKYAK